VNPPRAPRLQAGEMIASGRWLPPHAAADALGVTVGELRRAIRSGEVRTRSIVPRVLLVEV
jgi:hypothetical protein